MPLGYEPAVLALALSIVALGGLVKGLVGFGYAVTSTALLATVLTPATAVVVLILPMLVANLALLSELDLAGMASCARRFWPFVAAAVAGTVAGMVLLRAVPGRAVATALGAFTLAYVLVKQDRLALPGEAWVAERCLTTGTGAKVGLGLLSGAVFGASNVAVQVVAYLDSLSLDRSTFVGVLAMILVGISGVRLGLAWWLGLFATGGEGAAALLSVAAVLPGLGGVALGSVLRERLPSGGLSVAVLALLVVIGLRLLAAGVLGL